MFSVSKYFTSIEHTVTTATAVKRFEQTIKMDNMEEI